MYPIPVEIKTTSNKNIKSKKKTKTPRRPRGAPTDISFIVSYLSSIPLSFATSLMCSTKIRAHAGFSPRP